MRAIGVTTSERCPGVRSIAHAELSALGVLGSVCGTIRFTVLGKGARDVGNPAPTRHDDMLINVAGLLREPVGATRERAFDLPELELDDELRATGVAGRASLLRIRTGILVRGYAEGALAVECVRCLQPTEVRILADFEEEYRPSVDIGAGAPIELVREGESEAQFESIDSTHLLDMSELVRQALLVSLPINPLCREDCRGLCAMCGADRNAEGCHCHRRTTDPRLAALAALLEEPSTVAGSPSGTGRRETE